MAQGPWYVSIAAVRAYQRIRGRPVDTGDDAVERATRELLELARDVLSRESQPKRLESGALVYRTGRAAGRIQLVVARGEGDLPALVDVWPSHGGAR